MNYHLYRDNIVGVELVAGCFPQSSQRRTHKDHGFVFFVEDFVVLVGNQNYSVGGMNFNMSEFLLFV